LNAYADTSFLTSLYCPDANSAEAARRIQKSVLPLLLTAFGELELTNALQLRLFRREIRPPQAQASYAAFRADVRDGVLIVKLLPETVYARASRLAVKWTAKLGTRTLDIIHVAAALALDADTFNTFDDRQKKLAKAAGLQVP
jgi:predicted nucleic acid-binding protein